MLVSKSWSEVSGAHGCNQKWEVHWCVQRWVVSVDGICPGSLATSTSGLICLAHWNGPSLQGYHHIVHVLVVLNFSLSNRNFLYGFLWYLNLFTRDCKKIHHYWHLWDQTSRRDWIMRDFQFCTCSFCVEVEEAISSDTFVKDILSECVELEYQGVSRILFQCHDCFSTEIPCEWTE